MFVLILRDAAKTPLPGDDEEAKVQGLKL